MKTKNLFLAILFSFLLPIVANAAEVTDSYNVVGGIGLSEIPISNHVGTSKAVYSGLIGYDVDYPSFIMSHEYVFATKSSPGTVKSVSVSWTDDDGFYNTEGESYIYVYGSATPFYGTETKGDLEASGKIILGSQAFDGTIGKQTIDVSAYSSPYIAIVGGGIEAAITSVEITWITEDVITYTLSSTVSPTKKGKVTFSPASPVEAGTQVTVSIKASSGYELHSYTITGDATIQNKTLTEDEYTGNYVTSFTMPAHNVSVSAAFDAAPSPARVSNTIRVNGEATTYEATIQSGVNSSFTISTEHNAGTDPAYDKTLKSVTSANGRVEIVSNTYNSSTGSGVLTLRGLTTGADVITITTYQTNGTNRSTRNINITVVSRDVALVTELNDKYYAVTTSIGGSTATACELLYDGDNYYYKSGVSVSDLTWKMENANAAGTKFRIKNSAGKYLSIDAATMSMEDAAFDWSLNPDDRLITGYLTGLCYSESYSAFTVNNHNENMSVSSISQCIHEIPISSIKAASEYTRGLTSGNYATICLPYSISRSETFFSGVEVYNITGKYMSDDKVTGIEMEEETGVLEAGTPYIIKATASSLSAWHGDMTYFAIKGYATGLVGKLDAATEYVPVDCYGLSSNQLRRVAYANTAKVGQYKAYIDLSAVPEVGGGGVSAPGRIVLYAQPEEMENNGNNDNNGNTGEGSEVATSLEDFLNNASPINWNEPVYNTLGQRVGKGSTGVLIQNGQKFLVK